MLGLAVAAIAGYVLGLQPARVASYVAGDPLWAIAGYVASGYVIFALQSLRWYLVMEPVLKLSYGNAYCALVVGQMFNALLPARGGDLLRVQYLGRRTGKARAQILGTEIVDRWLDWWGWIPIAIVLAMVYGVPRWVQSAIYMFAAVLTTWGGIMLVLTRRGYKPRPGTRLGALDQSFRGGIQTFKSRRFWVLAWLIAPLPWLWEGLVISQAARAFGIELTVMQGFCVLIGLSLGMAVPSPGSIGAVEASGAAAMTSFGVDPARAFAFMFVYHVTQLLPGIITGVAVLAAQGERLFWPAGPPAPEKVTAAARPVPCARARVRHRQRSRGLADRARSPRPRCGHRRGSGRNRACAR